MSLNYEEINLILKEACLEGSFIQKIVQPSYGVLTLHLYKHEAKVLLISLEPNACRIHLTQKKITPFEKPLRFMELLRSRVKGAKITKIEHINNDRLLRFTLISSEAQYFLYIRLWNNAGNIILTDFQNVIIDAFYRRPKKYEISGSVFTLPSDKKDKTQEYKIREYGNSLTFNQAVEKWYDESSPEVSFEAQIAQAENIYGAKIDKILKSVEKLKKKQAEFLNADKLKLYGDLLFTNLHLIKKGMQSVELENFDCSGEKFSIPLNPLKTPSENAAEYYEQYKKAVSGLQSLTEDVNQYLSHAKKLQEKLDILKNSGDPYLVQKILQKEKQNRIQTNVNGKSSKILQFLFEGWIILVGRSAAENDGLLRHFVKGNDLWLHTRDYAGGYVFIKAQRGKTVPLPVLLAAGNLAVFYSKARQAGEADLYKTEVKYLRRAKNAKKGTVLPTREKNLFIKLDQKILKEMDECKILS